MTDILRDMMANDLRILNHQQAKGYKINTESRTRPLIQKKVDELIESIKRMGILQPIICSTDDAGYTDRLHLVAGAHRLAAIQKLWATSATPEEYTLPIRIITLSAKGDSRKMVEISENLHRNELSKEDRVKLGRFWLDRQVKEEEAKAAPATAPTGDFKAIAVKSEDKPAMGRPTSWIYEYARKAGMSPHTAKTRWSEFCADRKRLIKPDAATTEDKKAFSDWLKAQEEADKTVTQAEKAEKEAKLALYHSNLADLTQKRSVSGDVIKHRWRGYWKDKGSHVAPSDGTTDQWTEFRAWFLLPEEQGGPKIKEQAPAPSPTSIEVRWTEGLAAIRLLMIEAKAAGINVAVTLRDLLAEA